MSILKLNGEYESNHKVTVITVGGSYTESKFKSEADERSFFRFLNSESKRVFSLKLPENNGKDFEQIKTELFDMYFPRWGQR